ncbi:MAG: ERG4/ERG24 family protein [Treponema sp.]|nr:ERG4/ERG24 family protein [Treponema sp.]
MDIEGIIGFLSPWVVCAVITVLHVGLPAVVRKGRDRTGKPLRYKLNGHLVLPGAILLWLVLGYLRLVPWDWAYRIRWYGLAGSATLGLVFALAAVLPRPGRGRNFLADLWLGRSENPRYEKGSLLLDAKVWLYLCGTVTLQINVLSFLARHLETFDPYNPGFLLAAMLLTFSVWESLSFEGANLYADGFVAERPGLKLGLGRLAFRPHFHLAVLWLTAETPDPGRPAWTYANAIAVFAAGWILFRGATLQKYYFAIAPEKRFLGMRQLPLGEGGLSFPSGGFWGTCRHVDCLGEFFMSVGITLAAGSAGIPVWPYPLCCGILLFLRQLGEEKLAAEKYGPSWQKYREKVRYRIVPYLY